MDLDYFMRNELSAERNDSEETRLQTAAWGRWFLGIVIGVYLAYVVALAIASHPGFPRDMADGHAFPYLADKPVGEDGYYMLTVAWNIARGHGLVYNLDMPTTGVQPLSTLCFALIAKPIQHLGDRWAFVRSVLVFGALILLLYGHFVGRILEHIAPKGSGASAYLLGFTLSVFNFANFRWFTYGLETGIYLTLVAACILFTLRHQSRPQTMVNCLSFGLLAGLTAWARLDFGVLLGFYFVVSLLTRRASLSEIVVVGATAAAVLSPWLLYNQVESGHWVPSSGRAQAGMIGWHTAAGRVSAMSAALLSHLTPWIYSNSGGVFVVAAAVSLLVLGRYAWRESASIQAAIRENTPLVAWGIAAVGLAGVYTYFFWAAHFYQRYSSPILPVATPLIGVVLLATLKRLPRAGHIVAFGSMPLAFSVWAVLSLHSGRIGNSHTVSAGVIHERFSSQRVGAFQSGVIGFFNENVVNLDGKVNEAVLGAATPTRLGQYVDDEDIGVLIDWKSVIRSALDPRWLNSEWRRCGVEVRNGASECLERVDSRLMRSALARQ